MVVSHYYYLLLLFCLSCSTSQTCEDGRAIAMIKQNIVSDSSYDEHYKKIELNRKELLFKKFCSVKNNLINFVLMEMRATEPGDRIGLIYDYDSNKLYSFQQGNEETNIELGNRFDKFGTLSSIFYNIRGDVAAHLDSLQKHAKLHKIPDSIPIYIYYVNTESGKNKHIIID